MSALLHLDEGPNLELCCSRDHFEGFRRLSIAKRECWPKASSDLASNITTWTTWCTEEDKQSRLDNDETVFGSTCQDISDHKN